MSNALPEQRLSQPLSQPQPPVVWTIAGSDSGGGAGIQADIKTIQALGGYATTAITALTAQNTQAVALVEAVSLAMLQGQLQALQEDLPPKAVKLGMMGDARSIEAIASVLRTLPSPCPIVCDPVLVATSGGQLVQEAVLEEMKGRILPLATLLTPNLKEAEVLLGQSISTAPEMQKAAQWLHQAYGCAVLLKGGHLPDSNLGQDPENKLAQDVFVDDTRTVWLSSPWQETRHTHGTGCTLSAAIATALAQGYELLDAVVIAKAYVNQGLRLAPGLGAGHGPLSHFGWPETEGDLPWLTMTPEEGHRPLQFPSIGSVPMGLYPVVDRAEWLERLLPLGVSIVQLRVKDLQGHALALEVAKAVAISKRYDCRLFINDHWELAIRHEAYGVHLGQEDLATADLAAIAQAGLRLGVSTHCYREVARGLALQPSYMAIGPIFATTTKEMPFEPQGLEALRRWRRSVSFPLVAIGGIFLSDGPTIREAGADAIAVVRDITQAADVPQQVRAWQAVFEQHSHNRPLVSASPRLL